ncbi:hypothetical protein ACHWQZ_G005989 [Mnemiopsis leidyi]
MSAKQIHVSAAPYPLFSRFKPRLSECLSAFHCLPYFIQYLEYCKSIRLLHFLFACDSFREVANKDLPNSGFSYPNSPTQSIKSSLQSDALDIYVKFISMNAPHPIILPENIRISVENQISTEDGSIDFRCFDGAVTHVRHVLEESFIPKFHKSSYCAAYQLDVLRKDVCLADIILCQDSITHFMEFLEQKGHENHALFWVSVEAFQEHLRRSGTRGGCKMEDVGDDAIALYDTYLSLQARKPVNYGRIIRGIVESSICPDDGIITPDAFLIAQQYCYHYMDKFFFEAYTKSDQLKRYRKELTEQLDSRRKEEFNIKSNSNAPRTPEREALTKMGALSVGSPSTTPAPRTQSCPSPAAVTKDARSRDNKGSLPGDQTPTSSHRSSPFSSKTSSPQSFKRKSEVQPKPSVEDVEVTSNGGKTDDILDDSQFWTIPDTDYTMSEVDEWGVYKSQDKHLLSSPAQGTCVYKSQDKHLLSSPAQGSDKIKKSVLKLFGKEEITEEEAVAQAKSIVADVMNLTARPLDLNDLLDQDD